MKFSIFNSLPKFIKQLTVDMVVLSQKCFSAFPHFSLILVPVNLSISWDQSSGAIFINSWRNFCHNLGFWNKHPISIWKCSFWWAVWHLEPTFVDRNRVHAAFFITYAKTYVKKFTKDLWRCSYNGLQKLYNNSITCSFTSAA